MIRGPYKRQQTDEERFWSKVRKTKGCWYWTGKPNGAGYGVFSTTHDGKRKDYLAHRFAWELVNGRPFPFAKFADHECHNRSKCKGGKCKHRLCVRPDHLKVVSPTRNGQTGRSFWRDRKACSKGHRYKPGSFRWERNAKGKLIRRCKLCAAEYAQKTKERKLKDE